MKLGVAYPQTHFGGDPQRVRDFAQAVEAMGYHHLAAAEHVLGANMRADAANPYTIDHFHHDPFVLFSFVAAHTTTLELSPQVVILPQRQAALVAKQAASVDYLSGGRLRLGVGIGWNKLEYIALGADFHNRGRRADEQIAVMRALWENPSTTFSGQWHEFPDAGINPRPRQKHLPLWVGGRSAAALRRAAHLADGWVTLYYPPGETVRREIAKLRDYAREAGRDPQTIGIDAWVSMGAGAPEDWRAEVQAWRDLGVTHLTLHTVFHRLHHVAVKAATIDDHLHAIERFHTAVVDLL